ncbi:MAG: hypothetical protein ACRD1V_20450, partial [Vicinamibacterales bacterium]
FTASALDLLRRAPDTQVRGSWLSRRARGAAPALQYDPASLGQHIADRLEQARQLREQEPPQLDLRSLLNSDGQIDVVAVEAPRPDPGLQREPDERRRAARISQGTPWLWKVQWPWSTQAEVTNISRSGILLESTSRVSSGVTLDLHVNGMGRDRIVPARFVRANVSRVDARGVRYHLAAQFDQPFDLLPIENELVPDADAPTPRSLADLFASVLSESHSSDDRSTRFARGLRALVGARDVRIRRAPVPPSDDSESIYFTVSADKTRPLILQVLFDPRRPPTPIEFTLLKAAAPTAAALIELEGACTPALTVGVA